MTYLLYGNIAITFRITPRRPDLACIFEQLEVERDVIQKSPHVMGDPRECRGEFAKTGGVVQSSRIPKTIISDNEHMHIPHDGSLSARLTAPAAAFVAAKEAQTRIINIARLSFYP